MLDFAFEPDHHTSQRAKRSAVSYRAGLAAEGIAERYYHALGFETRNQRWRGAGGEIDLIMQRGPLTVFIEVKKAKCFATAAARISPLQMSRIAQSAEAYSGCLPNGSLSEMRIDVALVDATGQIEVVENAFGA